MGVSGSGKTTIGKALSKHLEIPFYDGDGFHPLQNIEKMSKGHALTDDDRREWLTAIHSFANKESQESALIVACSALKERYRETLSKGLKCSWVYLKGDFGTIAKRMDERSDHFMPTSLLQSQFDALEEPGDAITVDITKPIQEVIPYIVSKLRL